MKFLSFVRQESTLPLRRVLTMAAIAGLSNALILAIINAAAEHSSGDGAPFRLLAMFVVCLVLYYLTQYYNLTTSHERIEGILDRVRVRLTRKVREADLLPLEHIGRARVFASLNKEMETISQLAGPVVIAFQAAILLVFTLLYIAWLSVTAFVVFCAGMSIACFVYYINSKKLNEQLHEALNQENSLFDVITHMLDGFKEIKLNSAQGDALFTQAQELSHGVAQIKTLTQTDMAKRFIFSQSTWYVLLALTVFLVPIFSPTYSAVVIKVTAAILFVIGPMTTLVSVVPLAASAEAAVENVYRLEKLLDDAASGEPGDEEAQVADEFSTIEFSDVRFRFSDNADDSGFEVGPLNVTLAAGETVFVYGGNGSGKSTFLNLLTTLYRPDAGQITVDGKVLGRRNYASYRKLISAVFSDYHLFDCPMGAQGADPETVNSLFQLLEIENKVRLENGRFSTTDLSTGQRKRLALLICLLEDKPIFVLDEWAAEQDPDFRKKFYRELLPRFKQMGKTIIAVSHDEQYFDVADRILRMDYGRFVDTEPT